MIVAGMRARRLVYAGVALLGVLVLVLLLFPWNALRGPLGSYIGARLHRSVTIERLDVDPGWVTRVQIDGVTVANAPWSQLQPMATFPSIVATFRLPSLLRLAPDTVRLVDPNVVLEKNANGEANWNFGGSDASGVGPRLAAIDVDRGRIRFVHPGLAADIAGTLQTVTDGNSQLLRFESSGTLRDEPFELRGTSGGVTALRDVDEPYRLNLAGRSGATSLDFDGTVVPAKPQNLKGALHLKGPDLSKLYPIIPVPFPWTPPYDLAGDLTHENAQWTFRGIHGRVGSSDLAGDLTVDVSGPRPLTIADLNSRKFAYEDLGGFVGLRAGEARKAAQAQADVAPGRVFSNRPFDLVKLRDHDVDLKFRGSSFKWHTLALDNLVTHLTLKSGVLQFEPLDFGLATGHVASKIVLDVRENVPKAQATIEARNVELKRIFPQLESPRGSAGRFGGRARFTAQAHSVAGLLGSMDGEAAIAMSGGEASTLTLVLTNLDLARAATLLIGGDRTAVINCGVASLHARNGVVTPELFVVDTSAVLITGSGSIDFRQERYDLHLKADSKNPSLIALKGPIIIGGTFAQPAIRPEVGPVAARVGAAIGLGVLAPPLALLPLIDLGDAPSADCRALLQDARVQTHSPEPVARSSNGQQRTQRAAQGGNAKPKENQKEDRVARTTEDNASAHSGSAN